MHTETYNIIMEVIIPVNESDCTDKCYLDLILVWLKVTGTTVKVQFTPQEAHTVSLPNSDISYNESLHMSIKLLFHVGLTIVNNDL